MISEKGLNSTVPYKSKHLDQKTRFLEETGFFQHRETLLWPDGGRNLDRFLSSCCHVAQLLEQAELDLFFQVSLNSSKHVAEDSPRTVPDMTEEEQQSKASVSKSEPTAS